MSTGTLVIVAVVAGLFIAFGGKNVFRNEGGGSSKGGGSSNNSSSNSGGGEA